MTPEESVPQPDAISFPVIPDLTVPYPEPVSFPIIPDVTAECGRGEFASILTQKPATRIRFDDLSTAGLRPWGGAGSASLISPLVAGSPKGDSTRTRNEDSGDASARPPRCVELP